MRAAAYDRAMGTQWPNGLDRWTADLVVQVSNPAAATALRNVGNSVYPALPVFSEETLTPSAPSIIMVPVPYLEG